MRQNQYVNMMGGQCVQRRDEIFLASNSSQYFKSIRLFPDGGRQQSNPVCPLTWSSYEWANTSSSCIKWQCFAFMLINQVKPAGGSAVKASHCAGRLNFCKKTKLEDFSLCLFRTPNQMRMTKKTRTGRRRRRTRTRIRMTRRTGIRKKAKRRKVMGRRRRTTKRRKRSRLLQEDKVTITNQN